MQNSSDNCGDQQHKSVNMADRNAMPEFDWWRQLSTPDRVPHQRLIKIYNLAPFLYCQVHHPDNWITYAFQVGLLPSESVDIHASEKLTKQDFEKVCLVEECNDLVASELIKKGSLESVEKLLQAIVESTPVHEAVRMATVNTTIKRWSEKISCKQSDSVCVALLFVSWQHIDHLHKFWKYRKTPEIEFAELYDLNDHKVVSEKLKGNREFQQEKYRSALSSYTNGIYRSLYNYILYGNRAQTHLRLDECWEAMCDGCRCVILKPDWPKGQYRYAEAWYRLGQLDRAINVTQVAIEQNPNDKELHSQRDRFYQERKANKQQQKRFVKDQDENSAACQMESVYQFQGKEPSLNGDAEAQGNADSDGENIPDLVSSSDEEDNEDSRDVDSHTRQIRELGTLLEQGSNALLDHKPAMALQKYTDAQMAIGKCTHWSELMKELDYVVLLYAVGTAHIDMYTFKHIQEGLMQFETILKTYSKVPFPLVYLGLGHAYHRQNRFTEALALLKTGLADKKRQDVLCWPGTKTMITDSGPQQLKKAMAELMKQCKFPPAPLAICKFDGCLSNHYTSAIYKNDLDFKGYIVARCFDHCTVAYHTDCWKFIKGNVRSSDKGKCFTPDCGADLKEICTYDEDLGLHMKVNEKPVTVTKEKNKKIVKMKPSSQRTIAWRKHKLALRKQRKQEERDRATVVPDKIILEKKEVKHIRAVLIHSEQAIDESGDAANASQPKAIVAVLKHGPGGEGENDDLFGGSKTNHKPKTKKKKGGLKPTKVTMSLREFVGDSSSDDASETVYDEWSRLDDFDDFSYACHTIPSVYIDNSHQGHMTENKESIFSYFVSMLQKNGPIHITNHVLKGELQVLSDEARFLIEEAGGLQEFLVQSSDFTIIDDVLFLTHSDPPLESHSKNNFQPPPSDMTRNDDISANESTSRLNLSTDTDSVSSDSSSLPPVTKMTSSTAQLAPIPTDEEHQEMEKPCDLSGYSSLEGFPSPLSTQLHFTSGISEYSDLDDNDPGIDLPPLPPAENPQEELSDDEYQFLIRNCKFVPPSSTSSGATNDADLKRMVPPESNPEQSVESQLSSTTVLLSPTASLATFSDFNQSPHVQCAPHVSHSQVITGPFQPPTGVTGHNFMTGVPYPLPHIVPVMSPADKTYILELEGKQRELEQTVVNEKVKYSQLQHKNDESYNALQMDLAKRLSIADEQITKLCLEHHRQKESDDAHIRSLYVKMETLQNEIQERAHANDEYEMVKFMWEHERTALVSDIEALKSQLQNARQSEERSAAIVQEKDQEIARLTTDLKRERDIRGLKKAEQLELKTRLADALARAQNSEVELLKLKLDVGMQILSRSENDATLFSNMYAKQAQDSEQTMLEEFTYEQMVEGENPAVSSQIVTAGAEWHKTAATLKTMKVNTEKNFKEQIEKVQGGHLLCDLPKLPLPKPPQPPKTPVLSAMMQPEGRLRPTPAPKDLPNNTQPASALSNLPTQNPVSAAQPDLTYHTASAVVKKRPQVASCTPQVSLSAPQAVARPTLVSKPMEKVMLALHSSHPVFSRKQLKGYIDELRARRHGSLTGMKCEDIVKSVTVIIQGHNPDLGGNRASPLDTFILPQTSRSNMSSPSVYEEEEDPCIICHDELDSGPIYKLGCYHRFHTKCIDQWLQKHDTCPTCRKLISLER